MNDTDKTIIRVLERASDTPIRTLAKLLDLSVSTIQRRITKLEHEGIIKGYKALIDYEKTPRPIGSILLLHFTEDLRQRHDSKDELIHTIEQFDEVVEIIDVQAPTFDVLVKTQCTGLQELDYVTEHILNMTGIGKTSTAIILDDKVLSPSFTHTNH